MYLYTNDSRKMNKELIDGRSRVVPNTWAKVEEYEQRSVDLDTKSIKSHGKR